MSSSLRRALPLLLLLLLAGCATTHPGAGSDPRVVNWPYAGLNELRGPALGVYQGRLFSGTRVEVSGDGQTLFAEAAQPGLLTLADVASGAPRSAWDLGTGAVIENLLFDPDGTTLYVVASTIRPENVGQVQLARALLKIDTTLPLLQVPLPLRIGGYSRGLVVLPRRGMLYSLDSAGAAVSNGATLSRIDLIADQVTKRRALGSLPIKLDRRGLATDDEQRQLYALVATGGGGSDFDPPERQAARPLTYLATLDPDSLSETARTPLDPGLDYQAVLRSPRGVLVFGTAPGRSALTEIDTRLMKEVGWVELPRGVTDVAVSRHRAVLPGPGALYIIDLDLFTTLRVVPLGVEATAEAALTPDGRIAAVLFEDFNFPGQSSLALVDVEQGRVVRMVR